MKKLKQKFHYQIKPTYAKNKIPATKAGILTIELFFTG